MSALVDRIAGRLASLSAGRRAAAPLTPPTGGSGLNSSYPWIGRFPTAAPLWCTVNGMSVSCSRSRPPGG